MGLQSLPIKLRAEDLAAVQTEVYKVSDCKPSRLHTEAVTRCNLVRPCGDPFLSSS